MSLLSKLDTFLFRCAIDIDLDKVQAVLDKRFESLCTFQMNFKIFPAVMLEKWLEISVVFCLKYILETCSVFKVILIFSSVTFI